MTCDMKNSSIILPLWETMSFVSFLYP